MMNRLDSFRKVRGLLVRSELEVDEMNRLLRNESSRSHLTSAIASLALLVTACFAPTNVRAQSQSASDSKTVDIMHQMSNSFEGLVKRVSPAVVEVLVTRVRIVKRR
jgi:hypothetical protein